MLVFNEHSEFVGIEAIKQRQYADLLKFRSWAADHAWFQFHGEHYDWWMFPIDQPSSYGFAYTVYSGDIARLKSDQEFMDNFREGVQLLLLSWGWAVESATPVTEPEPGQAWANWPIRLKKCLQSTFLFGEKDLQVSVGAYVDLLLESGVPMTYGGRDLSTEMLSIKARNDN